MNIGVFFKVLKTNRSFWFYNPSKLIRYSTKLGFKVTPSDAERMGGLIEWIYPYRNLNFAATFFQKDK